MSVVGNTTTKTRHHFASYHFSTVASKLTLTRKLLNRKPVLSGTAQDTGVITTDDNYRK